MRGSYASHYRRMLPLLLSVLEFRSNNAAWRAVLEGLTCITKLHKAGKRFASEDDVPIEAIPTKWRGSVIDDKGRVNVISFELYLLTQLRERIRAKEIWVVGADRYRNPDADLPKDFAERHDTYYAGLKLTRDAEAFVSEVRKTLEDELRQLNASLPHNDKVRLRWTGKNRISVSPFEPAPEPKGLVSLKAQITRQWPMTGLLDTLKEAALGTGYLDRCETSASREVLARNVRDQRLLLCLYGLGTNAGLKRIAGGLADISYEELLRVRRNYIHPAALPAPKLCTQPIKRWLNWVELSRQFSCADICALKNIVAKSTKGSMWWRTGTAPTALYSSARAGRLLVTALKIRRSRPCLCTCCRPRWFTSAPAWCNRCFQILFGLADLPQKITEV
ncbi:Tn3 transposase DDE domain protein [Pseudovibrio sp. Ad14]|nr:Tn3 transposase DDE domain protein [Pseudovibrio sp. W74]KZL10060.1 Tn3 transposase DDE domain protein [Pseudovibrio sp. Ad14]